MCNATKKEEIVWKGLACSQQLNALQNLSYSAPHNLLILELCHGYFKTCFSTNLGSIQGSRIIKLKDLVTMHAEILWLALVKSPHALDSRCYPTPAHHCLLNFRNLEPTHPTLDGHHISHSQTTNCKGLNCLSAVNSCVYSKIPEKIQRV